MTTLTILIGIQGSGKSTLAKRIRECDHPVILEPDAFRWVLAGKPYHQELEDTVWSHVKTTTRVLLRSDQSVILDATNTKRGFRSQWINIAQERVRSVVTASLILTPLDIALSRNRERDIPVPVEHINRFAQDLEVPALEEGFDNIYILNKDLNIIGSASTETTKGVYDFLLGYKKPYAHPHIIDAVQEELL